VNPNLLQSTILYVDDDLLVVAKPAGLLSLPDGYDATKPHLRARLEPKFGRLWIVHRLDKDTSGVIVLARTAAAHRHLSLQFSNHQVAKTYHALIGGNPAWEIKKVDAPLRPNVGRRKRTVVDFERGKPAITKFEILERFQNYTLIAGYPKTGRTHQIRVHLYHLGFTILSDPLYGGGTQSELIPRLALHAHTLVFAHPVTGEPKTFNAEHPGDITEALQNLGASP
jgi:tRNA pseudouridine32 synthase / 23S rRNA pseudouridine746 synthase